MNFYDYSTLDTADDKTKLMVEDAAIISIDRNNKRVQMSVIGHVKSLIGGTHRVKSDLSLSLKELEERKVMLHDLCYPYDQTQEAINQLKKPKKYLPKIYRV